jgi:hypothetical protein
MKLRIALFILAVAALAAFGLLTQASAQEFEIGPRGPHFEYGHHRRDWDRWRHHDWDRDSWRHRHHHHWHDYDEE